MPQPQQCRIWAVSVTYTTAHGNAESLTHWAKPGIEPLSSWILVGFLNCWATKGTPRYLYFFKAAWCSIIFTYHTLSFIRWWTYRYIYILYIVSQHITEYFYSINLVYFYKLFNPDLLICDGFTFFFIKFYLLCFLFY